MFLFLIFIILRIIHIGTTSITLCPILTLPQHGFFLSSYCERETGAFCGIGCFSGYRVVHGDSFRECQQDGTWSGHPAKCEVIQCPPLKMKTQVIEECLPQQNTTSLKFGTKCRARCNDSGYRLLGPLTRECLIIGIWSGYEQVCIVRNETTTGVAASTTTMTPVPTTISTYHDYSNYTLSINHNDTGIILSPFQLFPFTIIFWFYLNKNLTTTLISLRKYDDEKVFEIGIRQNRLVFYYSSQNQTQPTSIKISTSKWNHFAWTYSMNTQRSYLYIDGARQHSFDFGIMTFDFKNVSSVILFGQSFDGLITRLEIWKETIVEQQILVSYRDCRKQNGNIFSWSKVSDLVSIDKTKLKKSSFCSGCSKPAAIHGGIYHVLDYRVGSFVDYVCKFGYEMIGLSRAICMVPSEWYPSPPICKYNPCTNNCELCEKKTGVCLREQTKVDLNICDPPCDDDEECIDGECVWTNTGSNWNSEKNGNICNPPCPLGTQCINRRCEPHLITHCSVACRSGQLCIDGQCGCYKGLCERGRTCYEVCETGERCYNWSCSCGFQGKCGQGEQCISDICMCGTRRGGCRPHEHCMNGICVCKTSFCDECGNTCKSNEICFDGKCVCNKQCEKAFCPFPCLNGGRCSGFYQCTCRLGWHGHRCEQRQRKNTTIS